MLDIKGKTYSQLKELLFDTGVTKDFQIKQIMKWIYKKNIYDISLMTDISKKIRKDLKSSFFISWFEPLTVLKALDNTEKALFELSDGEKVETVFIPDDKRATLCISTQTGCRMGCRFCQTARTGFRRNLTSAEILQQIIWFNKDHKLTNIVIMGMGEPLDNYNNLINSLEIIYDRIALNFSTRKVTVSTCGLIPEINKISKENFDVALAVSLNAADNETRSKIMPINKKYPIEKLIETLKRFPMPKRRKITFEYVMLDGINDSNKDCDNLIKIAQKIKCKINLIFYNNNDIEGFRSSKEERVRYFHNKLNSAGFTASVRKSRGEDISAACGQLYAQYKI